MKTVNLELSKQLKEAGYPQEGHWSWYHFKSFAPEFKPKWIVRCEMWGETPEAYFKKIASPTAEEILDLLPSILKGKFLNLYKRVDGWHISYELPDRFFHREVETDLADACAKMYLYLKKENLI